MVSSLLNIHYIICYYQVVTLNVMKGETNNGKRKNKKNWRKNRSC